MNKNKHMKIFVIFIITMLALIIGIKTHTKSIEKKEVETITNYISELFDSKVEYNKYNDGSKSGRVIVKIYNIKSEAELYHKLKNDIPKLSFLGESKSFDILSIRVYYNGNKDDFQYFDIRFTDIEKIDWENLKSFDDLLNTTQKLSI